MGDFGITTPPSLQRKDSVVLHEGHRCTTELLLIANHKDYITCPHPSSAFDCSSSHPLVSPLSFFNEAAVEIKFFFNF